MAEKKRAIALAGGGPAVGLSLGALKRLHEEPDLKFDVWSTACIGAWLAVAWNQSDPGREYEQTVDFFKRICRPEKVYDRFPVAAAFAPDFFSQTSNTIAYMLDPRSYQGLIVPEAIMEAVSYVQEFLAKPQYWNPGNINSLILNGFMVANPMSRFMMGAMYQSRNRGLSRIYYPDSAFLDLLDFDRLYEDGKPAILHNAYNLTRQRLELFTNKPLSYGLPGMNAQTLCACSALPYIEEPVVIGADTYCEGATVDTVNFYDLLRLNPDLDEVWVSRILDVKQIRQPENLYDALNNLVMLFAATTSEDDVKLFKYKVAESGRDIRVIEIPVEANISYDWTWENLDRSIEDGYRATNGVLSAYRNTTGDVTVAKLQAASNDAA